jgi:hypothetical protein
VGWVWRVGTLGGKKVVAHLTQMDDPLGVAVGNANELANTLVYSDTDAVAVFEPNKYTECHRDVYSHRQPFTYSYVNSEYHSQRYPITHSN